MKQQEQLLTETRARLNAVEDRIAKLNADYESRCRERDKLKHDVEMCQIKLERAQKLIGGLGGEAKRWAEKVVQLDAAIASVIGDILISAGSVAYLGTFTMNYREALVAKWKEKMEALAIRHTSDCSLVTTEGKPVQIREWNLAGLPTDSLSTQNGLIISKARRWPLCIDPQGQANRFFKSWGKSAQDAHGLDVLRLSDDGKYVQHLKNAIQYGKWVLIENIYEEIDPVLLPVLEKDIFKKDGAPHIKFGDADIAYSDNFRLFLTTKLPNPHYPPGSLIFRPSSFFLLIFLSSSSCVCIFLAFRLSFPSHKKLVLPLHAGVLLLFVFAFSLLLFFPFLLPHYFFLLHLLCLLFVFDFPLRSTFFQSCKFV